METLQRLHNQGSVSTGYDIENSAAFGGANGLQNTLANDGDSRKKWTISMWVKRGELAVQTGLFGAANTIVNFMSDDILRISLYTGSATYYYDTARVFRDTSAWYHIVFQCDTTDGTAANRTKLWINGELNTAHRAQYDTSANISQNMEFTVGLDASNMQIGYFYSGQYQLDGYMADIYFTDNVANEADAFGEYDEDSGIWKPKAYAGAYGDNGFHLEFKEAAASATGIGKDTSGNGHNFDTGGAHPSQATDTPTNNFCTMNPLKGRTYYTINGPGVVERHPIITNGATVIGNNSDNYVITDATMAMTSGKWYWEMKPTVDANTNVSLAGIATNFDLGFYNDDGVGNFFYHFSGGRYVNGGATGYGAAWTTNDIIGFAYDADNWTLNCYLNGGTTQGNLLTGTADLSAKAAIFKLVTYGTHTYQMNFGGYHANSLSSPATDANGYGTFEYAPPTGYYALCTKNLAEYG